MTDAERIRYLEESIRELRKEKDNLKKEKWELRHRNLELEEKIRFLEQCLDNKEKVNKSLREELQRYKEMWDAGEDAIVINIDKDWKVSWNTKQYTDC